MSDASSQQGAGGLFRGPPAFAAATPLSWYWALPAAVLILVTSNAAAALLFATMPASGGMLWLLGGGFWYGEPETVLLAMGLTAEVLTIVLTLAVCRRLGGIRSVLAIGAPAGGRTAYLGGALLVLLAANAFKFLPDELLLLLSNLHLIEILRVPLPPPPPPPTDITQWLLHGVGLVVTAPLAEELLFRGFLFASLSRSRLGFSGAALLTSALFAAIHGDPFIPQLLTHFLAGLAFSWLLWRTGSLRVPMVAHGAANAVALVSLGWAVA